MGNARDVIIDATKPVVRGVYSNAAGTAFKLTVKDTESGLDKITMLFHHLLFL